MAETTNLGKVVITPKGEHSTATAYVRLDLVTYNGSSYLSKQDVPTGVAIDNTTYWFCMAKGTYQIWLDEGNTGSASDYLNSITAYGNAVLGGYTGTQEQFYDDLALVSDALTALATKENVSNKKQAVTNSETDYPSGKAVFNALTLKIDKSSITSELGDSEELVISQKGVEEKVKLPVESGEQAAAAALIELKKEVAYLKEVLNNVITYLQINTLSVDNLQIKGAPLFIFSDVVPAVVPDFAGQIYIKTTATAAAWMALGDTSVANWKEI